MVKAANFLKKAMRGGLCILTLAGSFYGSQAVVNHLLPEQPKPKIEERRNGKELEDVFDIGRKFIQDIRTAILCDNEIKPRHTRKQIEEIVSSVNTPKQAFSKIKKDIKFSNDSNWLSGCLLDRWLSLQETYALGVGDCMDGATAFAAMLSDNPKYDVQIVHVAYKKDDKVKHAIDLYVEKGRWGLASFNDYTYGGETNSLYHPAVYDSIKEAVAIFCSGECKGYALITFTPEELKFGKALQKKKESASSPWQPLKDDF